MNCDRRHTLFAPVNTFNFTANDRVRRYSTPDRQDLETIYEVMKKEYFVFFSSSSYWSNNYYDLHVHLIFIH
jgi:hypothetical protein